jgi:triple functional domain protein
MSTSELGVTEHIEGDECKFAIWTGRSPMMSDCRIVFKATNLDTKQTWVKRLREVIQDTCFSGFGMLKSPAKVGRENNSGKNSLNTSQRLSKDIDDTINTEVDPDGSSLASFGSGNTTDSEKVSGILYYMIWVYI